MVIIVSLIFIIQLLLYRSSLSILATNTPSINRHHQHPLSTFSINAPYQSSPTNTPYQGDPEYYKSRLTNALGTDFANFTIEKKADATYKVVRHPTLSEPYPTLTLL